MPHYDVVYFSPHLDDAIFSCAGLIAEQRSQGKSVLIVTIFSADRRGPNPYSDSYLGRITEDIEAVKCCGAEYLHLNLLDAPARNSHFADLHSVFFGIHEENDATIANTVDRINSVVHDTEPTEIYFPLAIGGHIDHRLTFLAALQTKFAAAVFFYEDRPYVFLPGNPLRRIRQLGVSSHSSPAYPTQLSPTKFLSQFGFLLKHINMKGDYSPSIQDAARCVAKYIKNSFMKSSRTMNLVAEIRTFNIANQEVANKAIALYTTQIAEITGDFSRWQSCAKRYSNSLGADYAERYWAFKA